MSSPSDASPDLQRPADFCGTPSPKASEKASDRRLLLVLAVPTFVAQLAEPVASLVDLIFIGRLGPLSLAGVSVASSIFHTVLEIFHSLSFTSNALIAKTVTLPSSIRSSALARAIVSTVLISALIGILVALPIFTFAPSLCTAMNAQPGVVLSSAIAYLRSRALGFPALVTFFALSGVFRALLDPKRPLYASVAGNITNIILDPLLIFPPVALGCAGAGLATSTVAYIATGYLLLYLVRSGTVPRKILRRALALPADHVRALLKPLVALSGKSILENGILSFACACAAKMGPAEATAMEISRQWWWLAEISWWPICLALAGVSVRALAESSPSTRVRDITAYVLALTSIIGIFTGTLTFILSTRIPYLFITEPAFLALATASLRILAPLLAVNSFMDACDAALIARDCGLFSLLTTALAVLVAGAMMRSVVSIGGIWRALLLSYTIRAVLNLGQLAQLHILKEKL